MLHKPRVNPDADEPGIKRKRLTDGFTNNETRPTFRGRRRRLQHLDINVGTLDMTQTSLASQQTPKNMSERLAQNTSPDTKTRPRARTAAGLWRRPQLFGTSQFELDSDDLVVFPEVKPTPTKRRLPEPDSFGTIVIPRTDSPRPKKTIKMESPSGFPGELVQDSSPSTRLLTNRGPSEDNRKTDPLALRTGPSPRVKSSFAITNMPVMDADKVP